MRLSVAPNDWAASGSGDAVKMWFQGLVDFKGEGFDLPPPLQSHGDVFVCFHQNRRWS